MPDPLRWVVEAEPVAAGAALLAATRAGLLGDDVGALLDGAAPTLAGTTLEPEDRHAYDRMYRDFVTAALDGAAAHAGPGEVR